MTTTDTALGEWTCPEVPADPMKVLALLLDDPNPLHYDREAARRAGFAERVNHGPSSIGMLLNIVRRAFPEGRIVRYDVGLVGSVLAGQTVRASGAVVGREPVAAGERLTCEVELRVDGGGLALHGTVDLVVPDPV